jgi:hypothetical protein
MKSLKSSHLALLILPLISFFGVFFYVRGNRGPAIYFPDGTVNDFGILNEMSIFNASFAFQNRGGKPLEIKNIKTNCGCANAKSEKQILNPGETSNISLTYVARADVPGKREVIRALVETNDPDKPVAVLSLVGEVNRIVFWNPTAVSFYCAQGTVGEQREIRFKAYEGETLEIKQIQASSDKIRVSNEKRREGTVCIITLATNCPKGNWDEKVEMITSVGGVDKPVNIPVHLMIK